MPAPILYHRRRRAPSPYPQSSASSTSSAISISQTGQSSVQSPPPASSSTPTSHALQPTTRASPRPAHHAAPPPAVPSYPDIRRRLRYRNNSLAIGIAGQKSRLIQRLLLYCPPLSGDLCSILCTCENALEPDNPWLSASWVPLADTDTKRAVNYVPSPIHSHTWVITPDGLNEAAEVLGVVMKYEMPEFIHNQFTEAAHTFAQIYQVLQAEMRLYSGRYGAGREMHTKWEIHWNKNEQEEKEWKQFKYQETLKNREDVQAGRRHVMQTTDLTEEEIVQSVRRLSRKRRWSSSSTIVTMMEIEKQTATSAPPMRTYYQRSGFANRSGAPADWLSEVPIASEIGIPPAPIETSQRTRTTTVPTALFESDGWVSAEDAARAAAIMYTRQQTLGSPRMPFAQWVQFANSLRPGPTATSGPVPFLPESNQNQWQMNARARLPAQSQGLQDFSEQAVTAIDGQPTRVAELELGTVVRQSWQMTATSISRVRSVVPVPGEPVSAAAERAAIMSPPYNRPPVFPVGSAATTPPNAPHTVMPSEGQEIRARAVNVVNRGTTRRVRNGRSLLARSRDVDLPDWARSGSQARADDAVTRARNAASDDDQGASLTDSPVAAIPNARFHYEVQDGRVAAAATIRVVDNMRRARVANSARQDPSRAYHALIQERNTALHNHRADSTASPASTTFTTLASSEEQNGTASTAAVTANMMWQPRLAADFQPSMARSDDAAVQESDLALLGRYRAVLAEQEHEMRSGGRTLLERRADRRRASDQRALPRALDVAVTDFVR